MKLRKSELEGQGYWHFCPGCGFEHRLPDTWTFDGNLDAPTFTPSFAHTWGLEHIGRPNKLCHYIITAGQINYCTDSTHSLAGQTVAMPDLP